MEEKIIITKKIGEKECYFEILPNETRFKNFDFEVPVYYDGKKIKAHYYDGIIRFYFSEIICSQKVNGIKVEEVEKQKLEELYKIKKEERKKEIEEARKYIPKKIQYTQGDETGHIYIYTDELDIELSDENEFMNEIEVIMNEYWRKVPLKKIMEHSKKINENYYEIETEKLLHLLKSAIEMKRKEDTKKEERRRQKEEEKRKIFEKAKETGKQQIIGSYPIFDEQENDIDIVTVYAMPDGTIKEEREHTY